MSPGRDSTSISPPQRSVTILRAISRPSPVPSPTSFVVKNGSKIVPQSPDQITSEWLEQALSETDPRAKPKIASIDISTLSRGPMGQTLRLVPAYRDDAADAPASLVAKMPGFAGSELPADRSLISMLYANEVNWYRELARECPIRVPRSYWTGADQANGRFCLLLEDLGHLRARTQLESCDEADARLVVRSLARFHAKWWDAASLGEHSWLRRPEQSERH